MKSILGIIASPRNLGNSEIMVKEISKHIEESHELKLLRLHDQNILPCNACYKCLIEGKSCHLKDDFNKVFNAISEADALILAVPTYFLGANASLRKLVDRGLSFYSALDKLWGKPAVGVGIAGIEGKEGFTLLNIENFFKVIFAEVKTHKIIYGALPGEVMLNDKNIETAKDMAKALFKEKGKDETQACSLCGGKTFRFFESNKIQCMLCSNFGTYDFKDNALVFKMSNDEHEIFSSKEKVSEHREWLLGMRERFIKNRKKLKELTLRYLDIGTWIT